MLHIKTLIDREIGNLKRVFPDLSRKDFSTLKNGNYCVQVSYITTGKFACGLFEVLIEFPYNYPVGAPLAWVQKPRIPKNTPHIYKWDKIGHANICYLRPKKDWHYSLSSYEAAVMIESWLTTYCHWKKTGQWDWPEAGIFDHLF
ncbi:MAG: hypothetical protein ACXAC8_16820 [Candidatus Hodarchaeales archaeon]|jgi:hypothetical protein